MKVLAFLQLNKALLIGMLVGMAAAYFYWADYAIYWGTYPLYSEWWVNCIYGALFGALGGSWVAAKFSDKTNDLQAKELPRKVVSL